MSNILKLLKAVMFPVDSPSFVVVSSVILFPFPCSLVSVVMINVCLHISVSSCFCYLFFFWSHHVFFDKFWFYFPFLFLSLHCDCDFHLQPSVTPLHLYISNYHLLVLCVLSLYFIFFLFLLDFDSSFDGQQQLILSAVPNLDSVFGLSRRST